MKPARTALLGATLLLLAVAPSWHAQEAPIRSPLVERSDVQFVTLDLIVEKRVRGGLRAVPGILKEDLHVVVSGQPMELDLFEDWCRPQTRPRDASPGRKAPADESAAVSVAGPVRYILYFDLLHLRLAGFHQSFRAAVQWAEEVVQPQDEVMVITGGNGLRIVRPLLPASDGLIEDLQSVRDHYDGTLSWAEMEGDLNRGRINEIVELAKNSDPRAKDRNRMARAMAMSYASEDFQYARRSIENLEMLMSLFEPIDGTKNLIVFQDTIRLRPGLQYPLVEQVSETDTFLRRLAHAANRRNVRFYPVVAGGLGTSPNMRQDGGIIADLPDTAVDFTANLQRGFQRPKGTEHLADDAMTMLASETGGRVSEGTNELTAVFESVVEDTSCFYRIGFRFPARYDGDDKRITIQVGDGRKYHLRYRRSLQDPTSEQREVDRLRAAFLAPESARDLKVVAQAKPLFDHKLGSQVHIQLAVAVEDLLALRTDEDSRQAQVRMGGIILPRLRGDEPAGRGIMAEVDPSRPSWDFSNGGLLRIEEGSAADRTVVVATEIHAPPGDYWLVAVAEDVLAGTVGAAVAELRVPEESRQVGEVHLADDGAGALFLEMPPDEGRKPGRKRIRPAPSALPAGVLLRASRTLEPRTAGSLVFSVCDLDPPSGKTLADVDAASLDDWNLRRILTCGEESVGIALRGSRVPVPEEEERCFLVVDVPTEPLTPGDCRYEVHVEPRGSPPVTRSLSFRIVEESDL